MSKLTRQTLPQFGATVNAGSEIGQFGAYATLQYGNTISLLVSGTAWSRGWFAETIATNRPFIQDMNAIDFVYGYMLCYILQQGIPEYDAGTTYYVGSICCVSGIPYVSLTNTNLGNTPSSSSANWSVCFAQNQGANVASAATMTLGNDGNSFLITGTTGITSITIKPAGAIVRLIFQSSLTITNGGNLTLAGNLNAVTNTILVLLSDGTLWHEVSRSPSQIGFGTWTSLSVATVYQAATDGIVVATSNSGTIVDVSILTDSSNPPTTSRAASENNNPGNAAQQAFAMSPVRKGDYYKVLAQNAGLQSAYFISLGV